MVIVQYSTSSVHGVDYRATRFEDLAVDKEMKCKMRSITKLPQLHPSNAFQHNSGMIFLQKDHAVAQ